MEILPGVMSYLKYYNKEVADPTLTEDAIYEQWYRKFVEKDDSAPCNRIFADLFENLQIRSSSEVGLIFIKT